MSDKRSGQRKDEDIAEKWRAPGAVKYSDREEQDDQSPTESEEGRLDQGSTSRIEEQPQTPVEGPGSLDEVPPEDLGEVAENMGLDEADLSRSVGAEGRLRRGAAGEDRRDRERERSG
jgi:hypothetical protein